MSQQSQFLDEVKWNQDGLVPAIAQDSENGEVLMLAWMNREALDCTLIEGRAIYWSRSRQKLWRKGEESGNVQELEDIRLDCDGDTVLLKVRQLGGIACHTGRRHCFYRRLQQGVWQVTDAVIKEPSDMYGQPDE
ncbi:phosphoribosyl-AMP cyclohydrolase [Halieaceae bacterium IMCC14734]|uniref:Phosphoribosyl-AMP cyclohydrolase n=1 Tax=Candidatus Litorirhabdus singularis TaxID=2518993 RepID=A0ABT3TBW8_9GAMM|nr:phosphoribosyl-AMP cyclohydrolase [Candidatus Litorirhabdus singularis]MCX2979791.1 phosphoribosyl-AMP cyclohydrolase [Candidatus Litorirhabdus singularis]